MPRAEQIQPNFSFVQGIITEASPLTYPENATIDEANFELNRNGKRSRRLGLDYEDSYVKQSTLIIRATPFDNYPIDTFRWDNAGNDPTRSLLVTVTAGYLNFYDLYSESQSPNKIGVAVFALGTDADISFSVVNGDLVVCFGWTGIKVYTYDGTTISEENVTAEVRDIWGVDDSLNTDERPAPYSVEHQYNLQNQGWTAAKINTFKTTSYTAWTNGYTYATGSERVPFVPNGYYYKVIVPGVSGSSSPAWPTTIGSTVVDGAVTWVCQDADVTGNYPSNADIVQLGSKDDGTWSSTLLSSVFLGNSPAPKGKYIVNLFGRGVAREGKSGLTGLPSDIELNGFTCSAGYAGRLFIAGIQSDITDSDSRSPNLSGYIFFSKLVASRSDLGKLYQEADPTSEEINELIDTDGGFVNITEATGIHHMESAGKSLLVFAENGVWEITGGDSGFRATDYQVKKVTNIGSVGRRSIVNTEGIILYFAKSGIYAIKPDDSQTMYVSQNISESAVQTLYLSIPSQSKSRAKGVYTAEDRTVRWLYQSDSSIDTFTYDSELVFDMTLSAFYKHAYTKPDATAPVICGAYTTPNFAVIDTVVNVLDGAGVPVTNIAGDNVTIPYRGRTTGLTKLKYMLLERPATGSWQYTFGQRDNADFKDWVTYGAPTDAPAFMVTGYNISGDSMRFKQVPYATFHFTRTETGFDAQIDSENESGCLVTPYWDFANNATSGKIGTQFQAYRLNRNFIPSGGGDNFEYGQAVISTKNKLRGRGRALSLRFDTEADKDCQLLGWSLVITGNTKV